VIDRLPFPGGVWLVDAEFRQPEGYPLPQEVHCLVAKDCVSGKTYRLWADDLQRMDAPPFPIGSDALFVCYSAAAELQAMQAIGWSMPVNLFDAMAEYLLVANRTKIYGQPPADPRLTGMLRHLGLFHRLADEKREMQELAIRGGPFTNQERADLLWYCETDVLALEEALPLLLRAVSRTHQNWERYLRRALLRGDYMKAVSEMRRRGIPMDMDLLMDLQEHRDPLLRQLIAETDRQFGIYDGTTFKQDRFAAYLAREGVAWPRTTSGRLCTDEDTWKNMAAAHPQLQPLKELVATMGELKLHRLKVGPDGRNRTYLRPFGSTTARNAPSNAEFVFGPATWIRGLIKPEPGTALLYLDWKTQEIGIAAALSGDPNLIADYVSGDFYTRFGVTSGFLPEGATKDTHGAERELLKRVCLGLGYGLGAPKMAAQLETDLYLIRKWIGGHKLRYRVFWHWLDDVVGSAFTRGWIRSRMGWQTRVLEEARPTSVMNWPMQTTGSDMLRLAAVLATREGLGLTAPVHDALLLEAPADCWQDHARALQRCMVKASEMLLPGGFTVPVDGADKPVLYPNRYMDKRGRETWDRVMGILDRLRGPRLSIVTG